MSITLKLIEQSLETTHWLCHTTSQHDAKKHQDHHKQTLYSDPLRNSNNYLEKAEVKPDAKNSIATDHLATKPLQTAFHSLNLCSTEKEDSSHGRKQSSTEEDTH